MNRHARALGLGLGLGLVVLLGACSTSQGNDRKASDATTTTSAPVTSTSTTAAATSTSFPEPRVERVLADLLQRRNQAFSAPDPTRIDEYLTAQCSCYEQERNSLATLRDKGWHWATPMFEVIGVRVTDRKLADFVTLTAVIQRPPERVVDQAGNITTPQGPGLEPTGYSFLLSHQDGVWKIADSFGLDLSPETIRQITTEGVPS